ncbi:serine hydrolase [Sphingomonas naphthae]|uniref:Serine hydrolase n=1 Tax=Sphingomonas naphthae TaxID=1813468 RepID=A0ABY7TPD3_9SPHN|nr:serine hydrolase domain-containing protein [Sphingomonas naphthae]WCT75097.1 serine hydrolase [Sphingomonas naphthae]
MPPPLRLIDRRSLLVAGGAALLFSGAAAQAEAGGLLDAMNSGDPAAIARWAEGTMSPAGLRRRSAEAWGRLLADAAQRAGRLSLEGSDSQRGATRLRLRAARLTGVRFLDLRADRDDPAKIYDIRQVAQPVAYAGPLAPTTSRTALAAAIRRRLAFALAHDDFSGTIQVTAPDGTALVRDTTGWADRVARRAMTAETPVNIGSADKSFTAILIGQLVEAGRIGFDTALLSVLPDYPRPEALAGVTIRHLLAHRAGLGEPEGGILAYSQQPYDRVADLLPAIAAMPPAFAPGTRAAYSNEGYVILGAVIERLTGRPYWDVLAERLYRPAGMTGSAHLTRPEAMARAARGYLYAADDLLLADGRIVSERQMPWRGNSCGGGYSTAGDIARYFAALRAGRLLRPGTLAAMTAPASEPYPGVHFGMGFAIDTIEGRTLIGHSGGGSAIGVGVGLRTMLDSGWSIAVMGNYDLQYAQALTTDLATLLARTSAA